MHDDAALVDRAKRGDSDAYEMLVVRYERAGKVLALGILKDRDLAEDVVQIAFVKAYEKLGTLRQGSRFAAWLMQIVRRQAVHTARQASPVVSLESVAEPMDPIGSEVPGGEREYLIELLIRLPIHERLAFTLRYLDGHSPREIAAMTDHRPNRVARRIARYTGTLGGVAVGIAVLVFTIGGWPRLGGTGTGVAFAEVQQAIREVETAVLVSENPERPFWNHRILYFRKPNLVRKEWRNGVVYIEDWQGKKLALNSHDNTAQLCVGTFADSSPSDYLDRLANIERGSVRELGERKFSGKTLLGFALPAEGALEKSGRAIREVWVDPSSRLPVREEFLPVDADDFVSAMWRSTTFYSFNVPLDESLFRMTPPEGYTLLEGHHWHRSMMPPVAAVPDEAELAAACIDPLHGIGPAKFGMSAKEVVQVLGRPDEMNYTFAVTPEDDKRFQKRYEELFATLRQQKPDAFEEGRLRQEVLKQLNLEFQPTAVSGVIVGYSSRGFELNVDNTLGLKGVFCRAGEQVARDFMGQTSKGIRMGSGLEDIEKAYGPPDTKDEDPDRSTVSLYYGSLGMLMILDRGRLDDLSIHLVDKVD